MPLVFTQKMSVDTDGVAICRSDSGGAGNIPLGIAFKSICVFPEDSTASWHLKGINATSEWCKLRGEFIMEGMSPSEGGLLFYVKSDSGTIDINLLVRGT